MGWQDAPLINVEKPTTGGSWKDAPIASVTVEGAPAQDTPQFGANDGGAAFGRPQRTDRTNVLPEPRPLESFLAGATKGGLIDPVVGTTQLLSANHLGSGAAKRYEAEAAPYKETSPILYGAGEITGQVAPAAGMLGVAPKAAAFRETPALAGRMLRSMALGGAQGAITPDAVSDNTADYLKGREAPITIGALGGAALTGAGGLLSAANKSLGLNFGKKVVGAPTQEELVDKADALYKAAKDSGIQLKSAPFVKAIDEMAKDLRGELGYVPSAYPKVTAALDEARKMGNEKDLVELQALRKIIAGAQSSPDKQERAIASALKSKFDEHIVNVPNRHVEAGGKSGLADWEEARAVYNKLSKADVFDTMLEKAKLDKSKFSQSGEENSLATQLRNLAKNDKRMRMFTPQEQQAIKDATEGTLGQQASKWAGKFAPTGPLPAIFDASLSTSHPWIGIPLTIAGTAGRGVAETIRKRDVGNLADMVRAGGKVPEILPKSEKAQYASDLAKLLLLKQFQNPTQEDR